MNVSKARLVADLKFEPAGGGGVTSAGLTQHVFVQGEHRWGAFVVRHLRDAHTGKQYSVGVQRISGRAFDDMTDFGPPQTGLTEFQANLAIQEILDLDERGKRKEYLDERPER